jgi:hypothetical protein
MCYQRKLEAMQGFPLQRHLEVVRLTVSPCFASAPRLLLLPSRVRALVSAVGSP